MLKLKIDRSPMREHHPNQEKSFEAVLRPICTDVRQVLHFSFATNADGERASYFTLVIGPRHFAELARMMIETDPAAAIHAFGAAMQTAKVERRRPPIDGEAA
jgi:hypothetical protein